eukprot:CAMPEP_0118663258 /NCGR_PEP_ID=MMETSP0785-20121206/17313_1 /TAXON_ID=91992 /ORGANISM="Bolidomonas pacifica, Strain CCMP 1866" /LENGTH=40 /DNA_ID= /DNA_START= /DNA_END= /DNA_ORIENTATION=
MSIYALFASSSILDAGMWDLLPRVSRVRDTVEDQAEEAGG